MSLVRISFLMLFAVSASGFSQTVRTKPDVSLKPLVDPGILAHADGLERKDALAGTSVAYLA